MVRTLATEIDDALRAQASPARAEQESRYLKSTIEHYGVSVPGVRTVVTGVRRAHRDLPRADVVELAVELWATPVHERRLAAVEVLVAFADRLVVADVALLERLVREAGTWALVDPLAIAVIGPLVEREAAAADELDRWAVDDDVWIRRAALLALLVPLRRGGGDVERFGRYADAMLDETELFIRKAIGWVLRDTAKSRPDLVFEWLLPRARRASGVTIREAVKPLSEQQRQAILAAR